MTCLAVCAAMRPNSPDGLIGTVSMSAVGTWDQSMSKSISSSSSSPSATGSAGGADSSISGSSLRMIASIGSSSPTNWWIWNVPLSRSISTRANGTASGVFL